MSLLEFGEILYYFSRLWVLWSQRLLSNAKGPLLEGFRLLMVEVGQIVERIGHLGMLKTQSLLPDVPGPLVERLGLNYYWKEFITNA